MKNKKTLIILLVVILIALICFGSGVLGLAAYKRLQHTVSNPEALPFVTNSPTIIPTTTDSPIPSSTLYPSSTLQAWSKESINNCNAKIPVPPKGVSSAGEWKFEQNESKLFILSLYTAKVHLTPTSASDPLASVQVVCTDNNGMITADNIVESMQEELAKGNSSVKLDTQQNVDLWGKKVKAVKATDTKNNQETIFYTFTTSQKIYVVIKDTKTSDSQVKESREKIFEGLEFS